MSETNSPWATSRSMPVSAVTSPLRPGLNTLSTAVMEIAGLVMSSPGDGRA